MVVELHLPRKVVGVGAGAPAGGLPLALCQDCSTWLTSLARLPAITSATCNSDASELTPGRLAALKRLGHRCTKPKKLCR